MKSCEIYVNNVTNFITHALLYTIPKDELFEHF